VWCCDYRLTVLTGIGAITTLRLLNADNNLLASVPAELCMCTALEQLSLENNRLTAPLLDLRPLSALSCLKLSGNPMEFLPELSPCVNLRQLTLANVRVKANPAMDIVQVIKNVA
jgi:Leucine-rich repeat (LRR) protein